MHYNMSEWQYNELYLPKQQRRVAMHYNMSKWQYNELYLPNQQRGGWQRIITCQNGSIMNCTYKL